MKGPSVTADIEFSLENYISLSVRGEDVGKLSEDDIESALTSFRAGPQPYQERVSHWLEAAFGESEDPLRKSRRVHRFVEESLELAQSLDCTKEEVLQLVDYVFGRAKGDPDQEVGGSLVTLMGVCISHGLNAQECGERELSRVWGKIDAIREKNARQVRGSPLPGATEKLTRVRRRRKAP